MTRWRWCAWATGRAIHPGVLGHVLDGERYPCDSLEAVEKLVERVPVVGATCYGKVGVVVPTGWSLHSGMTACVLCPSCQRSRIVLAAVSITTWILGVCASGVHTLQACTVATQHVVVLSSRLCVIPSLSRHVPIPTRPSGQQELHTLSSQTDLVPLTWSCWTKLAK